MKDRVPGAPGQYKAVISEAELQKMQAGEQFVITMTRDDQPIVEGTPYSKAAVLPDDVAAQICPDIEDPTPADIFRSLNERDVTTEDELMKKAEYVLLWSNASRDSAFAAQTLAVNTVGYDYLLVVCGRTKRLIDGQGAQLVWLRTKGSGDTNVYLSAAYINSSNAIARAFRHMTVPYGRTEITFDGGYASDGKANDEACIPYYIYGIKGVS